MNNTWTGTFQNFWTGDTRNLDTPQEYLQDIRDYLIRALQYVGGWLDQYPLIKSFAWISLIAWFIFKLLDRK